jgi:hypothetical protein
MMMMMMMHAKDDEYPVIHTDLNSANRIVLLRTASRAYELLATSGICSNDKKSDFYCSPALWRNAGIISGYLAADLSSIGISNEDKAEEHQAVNTMFKYWVRFIDGASVEEGLDLIAGMRAGVNPVNQKQYTKPDWLNQWLQTK